MRGFHRPSSADAADTAGERFPLSGSVGDADATRAAVPKIIAAVLLGALLGLGAKALSRPTYSASAEILIEAKSPGGSVVDVVDGQMGVINSAAVLMRALQTLEGKEASASDATALRRSVFVTRANDAPMVAVVARASTPQEAARVANAVAEAYVTQSAESGAKAAVQIGQALKARIEERRRALKEAEDKAAALRVGNGPDGARDPQAADKTVSDAKGALEAATAEAAKALARLKLVDAAPRDSKAVAALGGDPRSKALADLIAAERAAREDIARLELSLSARHPDLVKARQRAALADGRVAAVVADLRRALRAESDAAQARRTALQARLDGLAAQARTADEAARQSPKVDADVAAARAALESAEALAQEKEPSADARILAPARAPPQTSGALGALCWALAGAAAAALMTLAVIAAQRTYGADRANAESEDFAVPRAPRPRGLSAEAPPDALYMLDHRDRDPGGAFAAAIDRVCAFAGAGAILVTARRKGVGRSTIAANLARAAASAGRRTLLIEAVSGGALAQAVDRRGEGGRIAVTGGARVAYRAANCPGDLFIAPHAPADGAIGPMLARRDFDVVVIDGPLAFTPEFLDLAAAADCVVEVASKGLLRAPIFNGGERLSPPPRRLARVVNFAA